MRFVALLLFVASTLSAQSFPPARTPERPVSGRTIIPAYAFRGGTHVAAGGDIALAAWGDQREGQPAVYAARLDADGNPIDPFGIRIASISGPGALFSGPDALVWTGKAFLVVVQNTVIFVTPEGTIAGRKTLNLPVDFRFAAATTGPDVRLLYIQSHRSGGDGVIVGANAALVNVPSRQDRAMDSSCCTMSGRRPPRRCPFARSASTARGA